MGDVAVLDFLAAVPPEQIDDRRVGVEVVPRAVQREVTQEGGVVLDGGNEPESVAQVVQPPLGVCRPAGCQRLFEDVIDATQDRTGVDAADFQIVLQDLVVGLGVNSLLPDEPPHVLGQCRILHQRQSLGERLHEPPLGSRQDEVERADHVRGDRVTGNPVQWRIRDVEVDLAGLDLYPPRIDLVRETARPKHGTPTSKNLPVVSPWK